MLKLFKYLKNYKLQSIIGPLFKLIEACFELAVPLVMAKIIDVGIARADKNYIISMGGVLVFLGVLGLLCSLTAQYFAAKASLGFGTELRRDLYHHINTLSHAEIDKLGSSTLVTRMTVDINQAQTGVNMLLRLFPEIAVYRNRLYYNGFYYFGKTDAYFPYCGADPGTYNLSCND